jgi:hypothetical protein
VIIKEIISLLLIDHRYSIKIRDEGSNSFLYKKSEFKNSHVFTMINEKNYFDYQTNLVILKNYEELTLGYFEILSNVEINFFKYNLFFDYILEVLKLKLPKIEIELISNTNILIIVNNLIGNK